VWSEHGLASDVTARMGAVAEQSQQGTIAVEFEHDSVADGWHQC
jgi:hypothetical protein